MNVDDLELELRKLPGVRSAGFTERDDVLLIQLQVSGDTPPPNLPLQAPCLASQRAAAMKSSVICSGSRFAWSARPSSSLPG